MGAALNVHCSLHRSGQPLLQLLVVLPLVFVLSAASITPAPSPRHSTFDVLKELQSLQLSPQTEIRPLGTNGSSNPWPAAIQRWTTHEAPTFSIYARPATEIDVKAIVRTATRFKAPFLAIGGSHGFPTSLGRLDNGIALDLSAFKQVNVNRKRDTVTVGGGVTFGELVGPVAAAGREIQTGLLPCVGVMGATLGGGIGRYGGLHGMMLDALIEMRIITAAGDRVIASRTENPDLFWGLRGAGFNFGIVVEAVYSTHNVTAARVIADFVVPLNQSGAVTRFFKRYETEMPAELSIIAAISNLAQFGGLVILLNVVYAGPLETGRTFIQPLLDSARPALLNVTSIPWEHVQAQSFFASASSSCVRGVNRNIYGAGVRNFDVPTFDNFFVKVDAFYRRFPEAAGTVFFIERFATQGVKAIADDATAYPHRDINTHLLFNYAYADPSLDADINQFAREIRNSFDATSGFDMPRVYVNYGHGDESQETLFGQRKLDRLRRLKKRYDPQGAFAFYHPLK